MVVPEIFGYYFYPRSPRGERLRSLPMCIPKLMISIHAPREGSDGGQLLHQQGGRDFYPRSPRGERLADPELRTTQSGFLSTLPARGATSWSCGGFQVPGHFYPRSPRGERLPGPFLPVLRGYISIHAPREGSDSDTLYLNNEEVIFLSTLPARGATSRVIVPAGIFSHISIHAPREGSDSVLYIAALGIVISIHAPREGSDISSDIVNLLYKYFYPRSPRGERPLD